MAKSKEKRGKKQTAGQRHVYSTSKRIQIGARVKDAREKAGMTQAALADLVGISKSAMCYMEQGKTVRPGLLARARARPGAVSSTCRGTRRLSANRSRRTSKPQKSRAPRRSIRRSRRP